MNQEIYSTASICQKNVTNSLCRIKMSESIEEVTEEHSATKISVGLKLMCRSCGVNKIVFQMKGKNNHLDLIMDHSLLIFVNRRNFCIKCPLI